jgi:hypothetical protein
MKQATKQTGSVGQITRRGVLELGGGMLLPGKGYPRDWETQGGGFHDDEPETGALPTMKNYGGPWAFNHAEVTMEGMGREAHLDPRDAFGHVPDWG